MAPSLGLRLRALLALSVFSLSLSLPLLSFGHFAFDDDTACGSVKLTRPQSTVYVEPTRQSLPPEPCALCHWLRAVGGARASIATIVHAWLEPTAPALVPATTKHSASPLIH